MSSIASKSQSQAQKTDAIESRRPEQRQKYNNLPPSRRPRSRRPLPSAYRAPEGKWHPAGTLNASYLGSGSHRTTKSYSFD